MGKGNLTECFIYPIILGKNVFGELEIISGIYDCGAGGVVGYDGL